MSRTYIVVSMAIIAAGIRGAAGQTQLESGEIVRLKAQIAAQQEQLEQLKNMLEQQQRLLAGALNAAPTQPVLRAVALPTRPAPAPAPQPATGSTENPCEADEESGNAIPPYLRLGSTCVIPVGFMDLTGVWRNTNAGSGIGTNFASVPYNNVPQAHNSEFRFSPQNSRLGLRVDGEWKGAHFIGYNEFDFLGTSGASNIGITNGAFVPRLRLFWVDVRKNKWEFLAGQSWSMLTPNRRGISPLPSDIFFSQVMDVNYLIGLPWTRQPGIRAVYHPTATVALGIALENPDQQMGGSSGAPLVTLPAALTSLAGSQVDNATNVLNTPNASPDIIVKAAFDPSPRAHLEVAAIDRTFRIWNLATNQHYTKAGGGFTWGINVEVVKNLRLITNGYASSGGGRYLFGTIPDLILRANGAISPIRAAGTTNGLELTAGSTLLFVYYGGAYAGRNVAADANGSPIGYGYRGSANTNNRVMEEATGGFNHTMWRSARYGAINLIGQYEYFWREPWYVAGDAPKAAHDSTIYLDLRYTLPGSIPNF